MKDKHSNCISESQDCWKYICKDENQLNVPAEPGVFLSQTISLVSIVKNNIIMGDRDDKMIKYIVF